MNKYRKRPTVIEAIQFTEQSKNQCFSFVGCNTAAEFEDSKPILKIQTIHGDVAIARLGDWIVKEPIPGHFYPIKPDIFEATYEKVEEGKVEDNS